MCFPSNISKHFALLRCLAFYFEFLLLITYFLNVYIHFIRETNLSVTLLYPFQDVLGARLVFSFLSKQNSNSECWPFRSVCVTEHIICSIICVFSAILGQCMPSQRPSLTLYWLRKNCLLPCLLWLYLFGVYMGYCVLRHFGVRTMYTANNVGI